MSRGNRSDNAPAREARLEVFDRYPRATVHRHALLGRKLQTVFTPPNTLPACFQHLLDQIDGRWGNPETGDA